MFRTFALILCLCLCLCACAPMGSGQEDVTEDETVWLNMNQTYPEAEIAVGQGQRGSTPARSVSLSWGAREVGSPCEWRGGARHCSRAMVGESGLETC